jgi:hypothetical protein
MIETMERALGPLRRPAPDHPAPERAGVTGCLGVFVCDVPPRVDVQKRTGA